MRPFTVQNTRGEQCVFVDFRLYPDKQYAAAAWDKLDPLIAHQVVSDVAIAPDGKAKLRQLWMRWMGREPAPSYKNERIVLDLASWIERKQIIVLRRVPQKVPQLVQQPPKFVAPPPPVKTPPIEYDWKVECEHHTKKAARTFGKYRVLQVVPDKDSGKWVDVVRVHYKETPKRKIELTARDVKLKSEGAVKGYEVFALETEFPSDLWYPAANPLSPLVQGFWDLFKKPNVYEISGAAEPLRVEVYNPHAYKLEISLPPFKSAKIGAKLQKGTVYEGEGADRKAVKKDWHGTFEKEKSGWASSKLVTTTKTSGTLGDGTGKPSLPNAFHAGWAKDPTKIGAVESGKVVLNQDPAKPPENKGVLPKAISFKRDNDDVKISALEAFGKILKWSESWTELVQEVKELIPLKVGWYMDYDVQFLQGGLAVEWGWKEFEDHSAFHYIDFNIQLTIISVSFEFGFGISACRCKAQIYAQITGSVDVSAEGRVEDPNRARAVNIPVKAQIAGAVGARVEAGNFIKTDAKAQTGVEFNVMLGINRLDRARDPSKAKMLSLDMEAKWTGIKVSATVSVGLMGIEGSDTWEKELMGPKEIWSGHWPEPTKYDAPDLSFDAICQIFEDKITEGWNLRVVNDSGKDHPMPPGVGRPRDKEWTYGEVARGLAGVVINHKTCSRTASMIDGLATAVRVDLDLLAERRGRDYVSEWELLEYLSKPSVRGGAIIGFKTRLDGLVDPAQKMAQQLQPAKS